MLCKGRCMTRRTKNSKPGETTNEELKTRRNDERTNPLHSSTKKGRRRTTVGTLAWNGAALARTPTAAGLFPLTTTAIVPLAPLVQLLLHPSSEKNTTPPSVPYSSHSFFSPGSHHGDRHDEDQGYWGRGSSTHYSPCGCHLHGRHSVFCLGCMALVRIPNVCVTCWLLVQLECQGTR